MKDFKKGMAAISAVIIFAGTIGCSSVRGAAREASDSYINALLALDTQTCDSLCFDGDSHLTDYMDLEYKNRAVSYILSSTHYRFEAGVSGNGEDGTLEAVYTLVMPNINESIAANPSSYEEFVNALNSKGKCDVAVTVVLKKIDGQWRVMNSEQIASDLYGSLYYPGYEFILDGYSILRNHEWSSDNEDGSYLDTTGICCHYDFTDEYINSTVDLGLTYRYYRNDEIIYEGEPVYDDDGCGVSFPLNIQDTDLNFDVLPEFDYRLVVYNNGNHFYEDHQQCTLSPLMFPDGTAVDDIVWQYTDRSGIYFNCSNMVAKIWLDPRYIDSGRPLDLTFDIFCNGELLMSGGEAVIYDEIAICSYGDELLDTGDYSISVYNNGTFAGSSIASVILNLDPDDYTELEVPDSVADSNTDDNAVVEICTGSRNAMDLLDEYTDIDYEYTSVSMNIFCERMDQILASGDDAPDIIICDSNYARRYALSDMTIPLNDIGIAYSELQYMYEYTFTLATDEDSVIKGVTWEITPGAVFYCRSAISSELGVSEPGDVSSYFSSWDTILDTARAVNESSGGTRRLFSCPADIQNAYIYGRTESWVTDSGDLQVPEYMEDYLPLVSALTDEELTFDVSRYSSQWSSRIANRTAIAYFGTMRFGELFLSTSHSGDWGIVMPPQNYYDGGNYIFVTSYCDMELSSARLIRDITTNEENLYDMAQDGYCVNNISVMMSCANDDEYNEQWLNGQNPFRVFSQVAWGIDASDISPYDDRINDLFIEAAADYVDGSYDSPEEAIQAFSEAAQGEIG
jgi:ABC-type glycerol-3-phosphate transport system substrate-binding protein